MHIAVEGCCHGELDKIYETMQYFERRDKIKIDLLLCCGDFQSVRDEADLNCMAVPDKFKSMQSFWQYYNGTKKAPYLTIFIGGNHEASNYLQELPYGGWVAPNIYYMGYSNVITYKGVRIGGISGIFKGHDFNKGHFEKPPYDNSTKRSVYHARSIEYFRMKLLASPVDIMMSHDWPNGIVHFGNIPELLRRKPFFENDIQCNRLGSSPSMELLHYMKPKHWFSGHLHVKFTATVRHNPTVEGENQKVTNFLALDKCLPRRQFLQVIELATPDGCENQGLCYDPEWLAVLRATNDLISISKRFVYLPQPTDGSFSKYMITPEKVDNIKNLFGNNLKILDNFKRDISPLYDPRCHNRRKTIQCRTSAQTTEFCSKLEVNDPLMMLIAAEGGDMSLSFNSSSILYDEDDEIPSTIISSTSINEDEIDLGSDEDSKEKVTNKTDIDISFPVISEIDNKENGKSSSSDDMKAESPLPSTISSSDESEIKTSSGSETNQGIMRLSLSLPAPIFGATSTPVRQQNVSKLSQDNLTNDIDKPIISSTDSDNSLTDFKPSPIAGNISRQANFPSAKNALLLSLHGKRLSDTESDLSESSSGTAPTGPKKFKRRNASFYTSQSEEEETS